MNEKNISSIFLALTCERVVLTVYCVDIRDILKLSMRAFLWAL